MSASTGDKITDVRNAARPNSARATGTRTAGGTSLACDNLSGWPTASKVHFVTYQINSSSAQVAGTQLDCEGIVSGNTIGSIVVNDGTDTGNSVNDVVEMIPTAKWGQDLADALTSQHSRTGTHTAITATSLATTGNSSIGGNETITGNLAVTGTTTLTGTTTITAPYNPYKFHVYRNAALGPTTGTKIICDTKLYDTGNNFNTTTGLFTAPIAGFYYFSGSVIMAMNGNANTAFGGGIVLNNTTIICRNEFVNMYAGAYTAFCASSTLVQLSVNDTIQLQCTANAGSNALSTGTYNTYLNGFLVSAT